jgi:hypothetical protein
MVRHNPLPEAGANNAGMSACHRGSDYNRVMASDLVLTTDTLLNGLPPLPEWLPSPTPGQRSLL